MVPVVACLAVTCGLTTSLPEGARVLARAEADLPDLPDFGVLMLKGKCASQPITDALAEFIRETVKREAGRKRG